MPVPDVDPIGLDATSGHGHNGVEITVEELIDRYLSNLEKAFKKDYPVARVRDKPLIHIS